MSSESWLPPLLRLLERRTGLVLGMRGIAQLEEIFAQLIGRGNQSALDLLPESIGLMFRKQSENGWLLRGGEAHLDLWGLPAGPSRDFVRARLSNFSLHCFEQRIKLPSNAAAKLSRSYIACVGEAYPARIVFQPFADRAIREGWNYCEIPTGHDCHAEMPDAFVSLLTGRDE